jgi:hypothetical protein
MFTNRSLFCAVALTAVSMTLTGCPDGPKMPTDVLPGEGPRLGNKVVNQDDIAGGRMALIDIRKEGMRMFTTPFNKADGFGDGPFDPFEDPTAFGGRPTLQGNGTFLRVNGLDAQTCLECHSILSNASIPARFAIGGVGASSSNAIFRPTYIDVADNQGAGEASFDGRFINPPFLYGSGGVQLLAKEMTRDLQAIKDYVLETPGNEAELVTKGVSFGTLRNVGGELDTSEVQGIDHDLIVRPFGRKGEFTTTRAFDLEAMQFHFGMQPVELFGADTDPDGDGVTNEILPGELSALEIFNTTLPRPEHRGWGPATEPGLEVFKQIGCAECHVPALETESKYLTYSFPEIPEDPYANAYYQADLTLPPTGFSPGENGGITVPMFADLKRHYMGEELAESFGSELDGWFTTARLWGVADTAPYLHDGRALTIGEAIMMHGGEAEDARDNYIALTEDEKWDIHIFLQSLRTPASVAEDLLYE